MPTTERTEVWELVVRFQRRTLTAMDQHLQRRFDRSLDDYDVLHQLATSGRPLRMGELAARLLVANSSCTRIVKRLAAAGLTVRHSGPTDRREVLVSLSPAGRRLHRRMAAVHTTDIVEHFDRLLDPDERTQLATTFRHLLDAAPDRPDMLSRTLT